MSAPTFKVTEKGGRIDVECESCQGGFNGSDSSFGVIMAQEFIKQHKCQKPKGRKP